MRSNPVAVILWSILFGFGIYLTIRYLWPLLLLFGLLIMFGVMRLKHEAKQQQKAFREMEDTLRQSEEERFRETYQDQLFREQAARKREEPGEIIDVEFTRKEENGNERQEL